MARSKIEINVGEVSKLLTSPDVIANLERRGRSVLAAMGGDGEMETSESPGGGSVARRARVRISYATAMHPVHAARHEAKHGTLARALAAGGGE